jgi:hypothetical protein
VTGSVLSSVNLIKPFKGVGALCGAMEPPQDSLGSSTDLCDGNPGHCDNPTPDEEDVSRPSAQTVVLVPSSNDMSIIYCLSNA